MEETIAIDETTVMDYFAIGLDNNKISNEREFLEQTQKKLLAGQLSTLEQAMTLEFETVVHKKRSGLNKPITDPEAYNSIMFEEIEVRDSVGRAILQELYRAFCKADRRYKAAVGEVGKTTKPLITAVVGYIAGVGHLTYAALAAAVAALLYLVGKLGIGVLCSMGSTRFEKD